MGRPGSVEEYIGSFDEPVRPFLQELRELSLKCAPKADESLKWGQPAYSQRTILFVFAGHRHHASFVFSPSTRKAFAAQLHGFKTGKGSVQLPYDRSVPRELLTEMIQYRTRELEVDNVLWK